MTALHCFLGLECIPFHYISKYPLWHGYFYMQLHFTFWWKHFSNKLWNGFCKHTFKLLFIIPVGTSFGFKSKALFKLTGLPVELHIGYTDNRYGPNLCKIPLSTCWLRDLGEQQDLLRHHGICLQRSYGSKTDKINKEIVLLIHFNWAGLKWLYSVFLAILIIDKVCLVFREHENRSSIFVVCCVLRSNRKRHLIGPTNVDTRLALTRS